MKKIEKLKRVGSILYDDDDIHASDSPATVLADKLDELIDWQNEMVDLMLNTSSVIHTLDGRLSQLEANTPEEPTTTIRIPKSFAKPTYQSYVSDFKSEGMTSENAEELARRLTDEPHTSDTSFRGAVVETVNKFLDDCNLVEASWCEEHKDGLHATVTIGEAHSIVDAIVKLAEEHYGKEQDNGKGGEE